MTDPEPTTVPCRSCQSPAHDPCRDRIGRHIHPHRVRVLDSLGPDHALNQLRLLTTCYCTDDWRGRGMHGPHCVAEYREDVDTLARCLGPEEPE